LGVEVFLELPLNDVPAIFCMGEKAGGTVLDPGGKNRMFTGTGKEK